MFDTKTVVILRNDLAQWQSLNVTGFLMSGITGQFPEMIGEPYIDRDRNTYNAMSRQPLIVLVADAPTLAKIHRRTVERGVIVSVYVEDMFATGHDEANRAVFAKYNSDDAKVVGIALRAENRVADKIVKGAKMHP